MQVINEGETELAASLEQAENLRIGHAGSDGRIPDFPEQCVGKDGL